MRRPCIACGVLIDAGSYCAAHNPWRDRFNRARGSGGKAATFRRKTLALTGGRCAVCGSADGLEAHHVVPVGVDPSQEVGVPLCHACHRDAERAKRR